MGKRKISSKTSRARNSQFFIPLTLSKDWSLCSESRSDWMGGVRPFYRPYDAIILMNSGWESTKTVWMSLRKGLQFQSEENRFGNLVRLDIVGLKYDSSRIIFFFRFSVFIMVISEVNVLYRQSYIPPESNFALYIEIVETL